MNIAIALKIVETIADAWQSWRRKREEREAEALAIAEDVERVYAATSGAMGNLYVLLVERRAKVRTWGEILPAARAWVDQVADAVGAARPHLPEGHREAVIAAVITRGLHDLTQDDDVIPFMADDEAIRALVSASAHYWRSKRAGAPGQ